MNTTESTEKTFTLPATGQEVPAGIAAYTVKGYKSMTTANGLADTANLYRGTTLVGSIHGDDNGGGTYLRPESMEEPALFVETIGDESEEDVLDALMRDTLTARELNKEVRKGRLLLVPVGGSLTEPRIIDLPVAKATLSEVKAMLDKPKFLDGFGRKFGSGTRIWNTRTWVTL